MIACTYPSVHTVEIAGLTLVLWTINLHECHKSGYLASAARDSPTAADTRLQALAGGTWQLQSS